MSSFESVFTIKGLFVLEGLVTLKGFFVLQGLFILSKYTGWYGAGSDIGNMHLPPKDYLTLKACSQLKAFSPLKAFPVLQGLIAPT